MNFPRRASQVTPKIVALYSKLFQGIPLEQVRGPNQTTDQFYADLLTLKVDRTFVTKELGKASRDACLGCLKAFLNSWFRACVGCVQSTSNDVKKVHALETLSIIVRGTFAKSLSGWEVMEVLAGSVSESDVVFMDFTNTVADIMLDTKAPADTRHLALQVALVYMCGAEQTSLGSYFLRRDFFYAIVAFVKDPETEKYTFEAILLLCVLINFHRSDAARLNPYLRRLQICEDIEFFRKVNWATDFALSAAVQSYKRLSNDTPSHTTGIISMFTSWRPDKTLASTPTDVSKELFKQQPIESATALLLVFEMTLANRTFRSVLVEAVASVDGKRLEKAGQPPAALLATLSLSSYILAHASSAASARASAYANLSLRTLLCFLESESVLESLFQVHHSIIPLSRQKLPTLPVHNNPRAPICALLDCTVLWLRHNLRYRLEVPSYLLSINIIQRVLEYLRQNRARLEYEWKELWSATLGLLHFIATRTQNLTASTGLGALVDETVALLECALFQGERFLPSSKALHEFIYELIRFSDTIDKLQMVVRELSASSAQTTNVRTTEERLDGLSQILRYHEQKVLDGGVKTAEEAMQIVAREIESEGQQGVRSTSDSEPPRRVEDAVGFIRHGCSDILALLP